VRLPDGTVIKNVPDGTTRAQLAEKLKANGYDVSGLEAATPASTPASPASTPASDGGPPIPTMLPRQRATALQGQAQKAAHPGDLLAGALRGAGSIGATLLAPYDVAGDLFAGKGLTLDSNRERRQDMTAALGSMGADTDSATFGVGKIGAEIAGTLPVGGLLARGGAAVSPTLAKSPALLDAIGTSGMRAGGLTGAKGMATRMAGGALSGGAMAGLVNPEDTGTGALVGGLAPPALAATGAAARGAGRLAGAARELVSPDASRASAELMRALDLTPDQLPAVIEQLRGAARLPGSSVTVAQALTRPQAAIIERMVAAGPGGEQLRQALAQQAEARMAALNRVAPTAPAGYAAAREDFGTALGRSALAGDKAAKARTSGLYNAVPQDEAALYLPDLAPVRDKYLGPGSFGDRGAADSAVATAQQLSERGVPKAGDMARSVPVPQTLAKAVRKAGGLNKTGDLAGEVRAIDAKNMQRGSGLTLDDMAESMYERGLIGEESPDALIDALRTEAMGGRGLAGSAVWEQQRRAAMGDAPTASKVTLREFDNLRKSIGTAARQARTAQNDTLARSLDDMRQALDDRLDEVVRGDGAIDENLPIDWANKLDAARKSKVEQVQRFRTGPQAALFKQGSDGQALAQPGGEVTAKFWGNRPGLASDVRSMRRLIADDPQLLGQFRSLITTEGAEKAAKGGELGQRFVRWTRDMLPGLREAFSPDDVLALQAIADDVERATTAAGRGMGIGSNTYQNTAHALDAGLIDSAPVRAITQRLPLLRTAAEPLRSSMAESAVKLKGQRLAGLLADAERAASALEPHQRGRITGLLAMQMDRPLTPSGVTLRQVLDLSPYRAAPGLLGGGD
jgi:hypothetical protein